MSKGLPPISLVIEWSPRTVTVFDGQSRTTRSASTLSEITGISGREAIIAVSRRAVFVRATRVPNAALDDVRLVVQVRLGDLFPIAATELAFDVALTSDVNSEGRLAIVAAMPSGELKRVLEESKAAGLKVRRVVPAAVGSALLAHGLSRGDAAVVQPVEGGLAIDVIAEGFVRASRVVPSTLHPAAEVSRTYSLTGLACAPLISGGGLVLDEADIRTDGTSLSAIASTGIDNLLLNLEPPEQTAQKAKSARDKRVIVSSVALVASLAFFGWAFMTRTTAANVVEAAQTKADKDLAALRKTSTDAQTDLKKAEATADTINAAFLPAQSMGDMIAILANQVDPSVWLTGVTAERGKAFQVRGTAKSSDSIYAYLDRLKKINRLRDVQLVFANTGEIDMSPVVNFSLSAFPVGNLPLLDANKKPS
jgi:Tfp pilus assembly protein PilN